MACHKVCKQGRDLRPKPKKKISFKWNHNPATGNSIVVVPSM